jgi:hypothetical protein
MTFMTIQIEMSHESHRTMTFALKQHFSERKHVKMKKRNRHMKGLSCGAKTRQSHTMLENI